MRFSCPQVLITLALVAGSTVADPTDWVNIAYVSKQAQSLGRSSTSDAQNAINQAARLSAKKGPWSVTDSKGIAPPSKDSHDYLSWAPYHWPDCNWCASGKRADDGNSTDDSGSFDDDNYEDQAIPAAYRRMSRRRRRTADAVAVGPDPVAALDVPGPQAPLGTLPSVVPVSSVDLSTPPTTTTAAAVAGTSAPPQAAAKSPSCTPSPTKPLPASATWTTCPYVVRDGKVNPDVRTLNGPAAINAASQSILYNALSYALKGPSASACSEDAVGFIDTFFVAASTRINPNMNFAQVVRGPGASGQQGTFTGVLDLRGIVKIVNAIGLIKAGGSPDWTTTRDQALRDWMGKYSIWLTSSDLGKSTSSKANNHATFYFAQLASAKIYVGDTAGAIKILNGFFQSQFMGQIAASGEQPLEAVRTRPWHYRCFNLEALITLAKLGDQLEIDLWTAKSRYGSTIQSALDFLIKLDPKDEDVNEVLPHVAAVAAVYGDPAGKYAAFLSKTTNGKYKAQSYFFYNQPDAFTKAPKAQARNKREDRRLVTRAITFECPAAGLLPGTGEEGVQLDDGIYVTCAELEPLYTGGGAPDDV